jgi:hypothetical protein
MNPTIEETNTGTYKEPFTQYQYGAFVVRDGKVKFIGASVGSPSAARLVAENYYYDMNQYAHNNMDMTDLDHLVIRKRLLTYGLWEDE